MRSFDIFKNNLNRIVSIEEFTNTTRKALFCETTTPDEISYILSKYEVRDLFDLDFLNDLIENLSLQHKLIKLVDTISTLISDLFNHLKGSIFMQIIDLVISDYGDKRLLGRAVFDKIQPTIEDLNILSLDEDKQIKFVISLTQDYGDAENRCKHICHLFNSNFSTCRVLLVENIIDYTLNYFGIFKRIIEEGIFFESEELTSYKELLVMFNYRFDLANQCIEFNSENFFPKIYEIAKRSEQEHFQEQVHKQEAFYKSSILKLFKPVALGRGGGLRIDGKVTPLFKISSSISSPMMLASKSPLEQRIFTYYSLNDWNKLRTHDE